MSNQSEEGLKQAYGMLSQCKPAEAKQILASILEFNLDNSEIDFAIWCCSYWLDFVRKLAQKEIWEQGESLLYKWKVFEQDLTKRKVIYERAVFAVQTGVFNKALECFNSIPQEYTRLASQKAEIILKTSLCNKKLGKFDVARTCLTEANSLSANNAQIIAEMADCCALCGMENEAKVLFREAFFIDAKKIDIWMLDSELIKCLIKRVSELGYSDAELQLWVPVYAVLYGIFNIRRELRSVEVLKLRQDIYETEMEIKNPANNIKQLKPKLIYMYFRLIDHYHQKNESEHEISKILLQIKILDEDVYNLYIK